MSNPRDLTDSQIKLIQDLGYNGMFAARDTITEAHEYLMSVADACGKHNRIYVITAAQVLVNTLLIELVKTGVIPTSTEASL